MRPEWDVADGGKKKMYTTQEEMRGEKERVVSGGEMTFRKDFAERRQALPPSAAGRERKGGKKGEKCVCFICLIFPIFFVHLYKHKKR